MRNSACVAEHSRNYASLKRTKKRIPKPTNQSFEQGQVLVLPLTLCKSIGKSPALFLQQLHYWLKRGQGVEIGNTTYIYNTLEGWEESLGGIMSVSTIQRSIKKLQDENLIEVYQFGGCHRINYYTINYTILAKFAGEKPMKKAKNKVFSHSVKMTSSSPQNDMILIKNTKITNINTNKSQPLADKEIDCGSKNISENALTQTTTAAELLEIWNDTVGQKTHSAGITKDRARFLKKAFHDKFESSIENWRKFCEALTQSDFLMGRVSESFKLQLDWVLKFDTLQKIFEGAYGVKYSQGSKENTPSEETLSVEEYHKKIDTKGETEFDKTCQKKLLSTMLQAGEGSRYHFSFHKVRHNFKLGEVATRSGNKPQLICEIDGYLPVYEEAYTDMFTRIFPEIIGMNQKLRKEQILFKKEGII